jgi:type II secretory pathway predicted ATPase ExeA
MYEDFFGLRARPFGITPSADLFFQSSAHRRTLAYLKSQVLAGEPLIVLIGNIGAGKTTVLQALLRDLPERFALANVVSTQLDEIELTRSVLLAFGAAATGGSLDELRNALRSHLADLRSHDRRGLLVVDEAQNFSAETLRYLLQLPELEPAMEESSLQVIISGQPGLQSLLVEAAGGDGDKELPICRLGPMSTMDTGSYVRHRLRVVGTTDGPTFSDDALDQVRVATGGLPRLVNRLCERVLMSAYLDGTRDIDSARVTRSAAALSEEVDDFGASLSPHGSLPVQAEPPTSQPEEPVPGVVGSGVDAHAAPADASPPAPAPQHPPDAVAPPGKLPQPADSDARGGRQRHYWPTAAAAALLAVSLGWLAYDRSGPRDRNRLAATGSANLVAPAAKTEARPSVDQSSASTPRADDQLPLKPTAKRGVVEPPMQAPSQPVDARAAFGLANSGESTTTPPPAGAPACTEATKALGLCP